jgi:hypothetical protein
MKFLAFSRTGAKTLMVFTRAVPMCAKRDVAVVTRDSRLQSFSHFSTLLRSPAAQLKSGCAWAPKLHSARYCELLIGVVFAAITLAFITGCGGSSGPSASAAVIEPATPSISPGTGTYTGTQQVTISDATQGATIYYTIDGTVPTASSTPYTSPISISASSTVQAIAVLGGVSSSVASSALTINPAHPPAKLAFVQQPSNVLTGVAIAPAVQVTIQDADGNAVTTATNPVTLALTAGTGLTGTLTVTPQNGIAAFSNLTLSNVGSYTLLATSSGLTSATSSSFSVDTPVKLAFMVQPSNALTGAAISPAVQVAVQDSTGNTVTAPTNPVTLALTAGTGLGGTLTVTPQNGVATFSSLTLSTAGTYTLVASSSGLTSSTSASFTVTTPVKLAFMVQPSNALTGAAISPAVQVAVQDANGNTVTADSSPVTLALAGSTALGGTPTVNAQNGVATFSNLTVESAGNYMLTATSPSLTPATSKSFTVTTPPATYYLAPNGSDSNSGLSSSEAWLSPDHPLNCGDKIVAASGAYSAGNFNNGKWGVVSCLLGNNVAWLQCASFDTCKISSTSSDGMWVDQSYWGVQGWEITTSTNIYSACFHAGPRPATSANVHHIIFANNVANGCMGGGFTAYDLSTSASVDYIAYVGNIAYNSAQGRGECYSGLNIYQPIASDTNPGTHLYIAGNFSYSNLDPNPCSGTAPTDGEGVILDTFDFSHNGGPPYAQQVLVENNVFVNNGGRGIEVLNNSAGSSHAAIYITQNTTWGNLTDPNQNGTGCGEFALDSASDTRVYGNLISTRSATGCGVNPIYALSVQFGNSTDSIDENFAFGYSGNNTYLANSGGFAYGSKNLLGTNPGFANPVVPGAPNCQTASNVTNCMAPVIADFAPTAASAKGFGYQAPSSTSTPDPLFPQWLCSANLPSGLITLGCTGP